MEFEIQLFACQNHTGGIRVRDATLGREVVQSSSTCQDDIDQQQQRQQWVWHPMFGGAGVLFDNANAPFNLRHMFVGAC
jgi:hypothetical protein